MKDFLTGFTQPSIEPARVASAAGQLKRYRFMAFLTGTLLLFGTIMLIIQWSGGGQIKPLMAVVWIAHGWLFIVYLLVAFQLGVRLKWPLPRLALVALAGTVPTASFIAEHFVTSQARAIADPQPVPSRD